MSEVTFSGRIFTPREIELMRAMARDYAGLGVIEIARTVCELLTSAGSCWSSYKARAC